MAATIVVVDDEEIVLKSCEKILHPKGYEVRGFKKAEEALALIEEKDIDLLIADLKMPGMDGMELIRRVRAQNPSVAIVVITGYPSQETLQETLQYGIVDYLPKPFSPELLLDVTDKAIKAVKAKKTEELPVEVQDVQEKYEQIMEIINRYRNKPGALIPVLEEVQEVLGYLPPTVQRLIARELNLPVSEVHGVVSFYSFFTMKPKGRYGIRVCMGTACYVKRANEVLKNLSERLGIQEGDITADRKFSLETVRCLGLCALAPVVMVNEDVHASVDPMKTDEILKKYQ